jgi:hypothetical protein
MTVMESIMTTMQPMTIQLPSWNLVWSLLHLEVTNDGTYYYNGIARVNGDNVLMSTIKLMNEFPITYAEEIVEYDTYDADQQDAGASSASSSLSTNESESVILPTYVIKMDKERGNIYISSYKKMMTIRVDIYLHDAVGMLGHRTINGMIDRAMKAYAKADDGTKQFCIDDVLQTGDVSMAFGYGIHR